MTWKSVTHPPYNDVIIFYTKETHPLADRHKLCCFFSEGPLIEVRPNGKVAETLISMSQTLMHLTGM